MRKKYVVILSVAAAMLALVFLTQEIHAGSRDMVATKRDVFQDDGSVSMRDMFKKREQDDERFRETLISNSEESIRLLREIRDLLVSLNEKE